MVNNSKLVTETEKNLRKKKRFFLIYEVLENDDEYIFFILKYR